MLIFITKDTAITYHQIKLITYDKLKDITQFKLSKNEWVSAKGDWRKRIVNALKVKAIALYADRLELQA